MTTLHFYVIIPSEESHGMLKPTPCTFLRSLFNITVAECTFLGNAHRITHNVLATEIPASICGKWKVACKALYHAAGVINMHKGGSVFSPGFENQKAHFSLTPFGLSITAPSVKHI